MSPRDVPTPSASPEAPVVPGFQPATRPRDRVDTRLLVVGEGDALVDTTVAALADHLRARDLVVLNDAATLPASLPVEVDEDAPGRAALELRLAEAPGVDGRARAVLFGPGTWRQRTEDRAPPPGVAPGARLTVRGAPELPLHVESVSPLSSRLLGVRFTGPRDLLDAALYRVGRPIQYAYLEHDLPLWAVQTAYATRPWAVEPASAGLGLSWALLLSLRARGVALATVTHAAGLSSTGDPAIDAALPLPERSDVPQATLDAVGRTRAQGGRVIAIGTSVVRALEGRFADDSPEPGERVTAYKLGWHTPRRVVDGLLTGMHAPGESHHALLGAFLDRAALDRATHHAIARGYLAHELGDAMLVLRS